jgi:hypothetical protein
MAVMSLVDGSDFVVNLSPASSGNRECPATACITWTDPRAGRRRRPGLAGALARANTIRSPSRRRSNHVRDGDLHADGDQ